MNRETMLSDIDFSLNACARSHVAHRLVTVAPLLSEIGAHKLATLLREAADKWMNESWTPPEGYRLVAATAPAQAANGSPLHYLSGPMTGYPDCNYPAFHAAAKALRDAGINVINPAELGAHANEWAACMRTDIKALCDCDAIILMPGWETSAGAHLELHIAHRIGLRIEHLRDLLPTDPQPYDQGERAYVAEVSLGAGIPVGGAS